jgi:hypothetical protein
MTCSENEVDDGGEAPCFAHLLNEEPAVPDAVLAELVRSLADAVIIADGTAPSHSGTRRPRRCSAGRQPRPSARLWI